MTRNWQNVFQLGGDLEDPVVNYLEQLEVDITTLLAGGGGGGIANPLTADLDGGGHNLTNFADITVTGLTGATAGARFVGGTVSGAPLTGTFVLGDFVIDQTGTIWICTFPGTPGTWTQISGGGGGGGIQNPLTSNLDGGGHDLTNFDDVSLAGLTGATAGLRIAGATTSGAPASGVWQTGDVIFPHDGGLYTQNANGNWVPGGGTPWQSSSPLGADKRPATQILMSHYDTDPTAADHTTALQSALDAAGAIILAGHSANVQIVMDSRQIYNIGGAVTAGANGEWAQIHWPFSRADASTPVGTIELAGQPGGNPTFYGSAGASPTAIRCTLTSAPSFVASRGIASMIGGPSSYANPSRGGASAYLKKNVINMAFRDLNIRGGGSNGPVICGIDCGFVMGLIMDKVAFDTDQAAVQLSSGVPLTSWTKYANPQGVPFIAPQVNCYLGAFVGTVQTVNWPTGPLLGEAGIYQNIQTLVTTGSAINLDAAYHTNYIGYLLDIDTTYGITGHDPSNSSYVVTTSGSSRTTPSNPAPGLNSVWIGSWDVQRNNNETGATLNRVYDLWDANGNTYIDARYTNVLAGVGATSGAGGNPVIIMGSGSSLTGNTPSRILDTYVPPGPQTTAMIASATPVRNGYSRAALVKVSGGVWTDFSINGVSQGTTNPFLVPANAVVKITYSSAPTWTWTVL